MIGQGWGSHRRVAVGGGVIVLSSVLGGYLALPAAAEPAEVAGTPCTVTARACVDLDKQNAWLIKDGKVTEGPIRISSGGAGKETPQGTFHVYAKDRNFHSTEFPLPNGQPAPMPWSVFFEPGGIAFHGGDPKRASAGCVHVPSGDAQTFFNTLAVGDEVQVTETTKHRKGGFYGVNHLDRPDASDDNKKSHDKKSHDKKGPDGDSGDKKKSHKKSDDKKSKD